MIRRRWPALVLLGGVAACAALAIAALSEPGALDGSDGVLPLAVALVLLGYVVVAVIAVRDPASGQARGVAFGLAAGLMWLVEIAAGGPIFLSRVAEVAVGATFALAAVATTVVAGVWAARHASAGVGLWTATFAGLVSGVVVFIGGVAMTLTFMGRLGSRADYQQQLTHSGLPSMRVFLVQDAVTGYGAHLLINPAIGLLGGVLGWRAFRATEHLPRTAKRDHRKNGTSQA